MRSLRFVGLDETGSRLLVKGDDGGEFAVEVDDRLVAAVRRTPGAQAEGQRHGQVGRSVDAGVESLSPREIQSRVRSGESPDALAEASGVDVERVLRYARPVLQEREHVAETARRVPIRSGAIEGPLGEVVDERLGQVVAEPGATWDSWRREDGRWTVSVTFRDDVQQRNARWTFDPATRSVTVEDETARWLTDGAAAPVPTMTPPTAPRPTRGGRRLLSVPDLEPAPSSYDEDEIADELAALGLQPVAAEPEIAEVDVVEVVTFDDEGEIASDTLEVVAFDESGEVVIEAQAELDIAVEPPAEVPAAKPARKPARKAKRASVPSWDDIVFGSRKPSE